MTVEMEVSETRSHLRSRQQEKGREACATLMLTKLSKVNLVSREAWHFGRRRDFRCRSIQVGDRQTCIQGGSTCRGIVLHSKAYTLLALDSEGPIMRITVPHSGAFRRLRGIG